MFKPFRSTEFLFAVIKNNKLYLDFESQKLKINFKSVKRFKKDFSEKLIHEIILDLLITTLTATCSYL